MRNGTEEHIAWADDLAAYALGALEPNDTPAFERHLATCPRCQAELPALREAVDAIPSAIEQIAPPRRLRRQLLGTIRREAKGHPAKRATGLRALRTAGVIALAAGAGAVGYVIAGPGAASPTSIPARASASTGDAGGRLMRAGDLATLRVRHMPRLRRGEVYELWIQAGSRLRPSTLFVVDRHGDGAAVVEGSLAGADQVMVTREPRGGSRQPTSSPLLRAPLD
jgi:anti-sigma-K factor RskA